MKFCFVVLHYLEGAVKDTIECVDSVLANIRRADYQIIVVDNGSADSSLEQLRRRFDQQQRVDILPLPANTGFARGNNAGCAYARTHYKPDFLIVINNDTIIRQAEFLDIIERAYQQKPFAVLGPYIYARNLDPQNPMQRAPVTTLAAIKVRMGKIQKQLDALTAVSLSAKIRIHMKRMLRRCRITSKLMLQRDARQTAAFTRIDPEQTAENVLLHGSALVFSADYFAEKSYIFYPETFLYAEEDILYYICQRDKHVMRYLPELKIYHKEDASTDAFLNAKQDKQQFMLEHQLKSFAVFRALVLADEQACCKIG